MKCALIVPLVAAVLGSTCARASDNPLGIYVGAAAGLAYDTYTQLRVIPGQSTGWKLTAGLRPIPFLGAELEYIDFGSSRFAASSIGQVAGQTDGRAHARAGGLFAVGFLPVPLSTVDVFAKLGAERVRTTADGSVFPPPVFACPLVVGPGIPPCPQAVLVHARDSETAFAYGGGLQLRLRSVALRAEYQRTDTGLGQPALVSFGVNWSF